MTAENKPKTLNGFDTQKIIELMLRPLPDKAYKKHGGKSFLTTISPDYTRERLTKIFGLFGIGWGLNWETRNTKEWTSQTTAGKDRYNFAIQQAEFWFSFGTDIISFLVTGYSENDNLGDAMKGARTSCISDGAKQLLFQLHIYKDTDYQPPKFEDEVVDQNTGEVLSLPPIPEEKSQPAPKPTANQSTGEVISPHQAAGFDTNGTPANPAKKEFAFPSDAAKDFFKTIEKVTKNYWQGNGYHFSRTMELLKLDWSFLNSQDDTEKVTQQLKQHASNRRDEKAAANG